MKKNLLSLLFVVALAACSRLPKEAYFEHGQPESLLDASSEVVNVDLRSASSLKELTKWVNRDQPSRAELHCNGTDPLCGKAKRVLEQFAVSSTTTPSNHSHVALIYDRVVARDCENRFIDNHINPYELNHPTFGCSIASNMLQMVSDKRQFTSPALMEDPAADKAAQALDSYHSPNAFQPSKVDMNLESILDNMKTTGGTR